MLVNIVTPCTRPENLLAIQESINAHANFKYRWHIIFENPKLDNRSDRIYIDYLKKKLYDRPTKKKRMKGDTDEAMDKINLETADDAARLDLSTTYSQKDEVKGRGARWDDTKRTWYITVSEWKQDPDFWNNFAPTLIETSDCPF